MNKTKIDWCDYTINPIKGLCKGGCSYCYARKMYKRFKWNTEIDFKWGNSKDKLSKLNKPSRIFIGSTHDIFGEWIQDGWIVDIIELTSWFPQHTFIFLTKNPERYADFKFPKNCWLGLTIDKLNNKGRWAWETFIVRNIYRNEYNQPNLKFISLEPLLYLDWGWLGYLMNVHNPDWIIVGGLTPKPVHKKEWVDRIIKQARRQNIPIFLKENLKWPKKIQEFPRRKK